MRQGQVSTEYLIIIAIIMIIIGVLLFTVFDITPPGYTASTRLDAQTLAAFEIGILDYGSTPNQTRLRIVNNNAGEIKIFQLFLNEQEMDVASLPLTLASRERVDLISKTLTTPVDQRYDYKIRFEYRDQESFQLLSLEDDVYRIVGVGTDE